MCALTASPVERSMKKGRKRGIALRVQDELGIAVTAKRRDGFDITGTGMEGSER